MSSIVVRSPAGGAVLGEVPVATPEIIRERVEAAAHAQGRWRRTTLRERAALLRRLRGEVLGARGRIAELIAREQGKPVLAAYLAEVFPCIDHLTFLILDGRRLLSPRPAPHVQPFLAGRRARYHFQPYGVWAVISPWNYPFVIPFLQASTLVFSGNAVVLKPSPVTPLTGELVKETFLNAGFPPGLVEVAHGGAPEGERLVRSPGVRAVLFTGGPDGGRKVLAAAADGLKKVVLELGGKDAALVLADAPLERAARGIAWAAMFNSGQTCASVERVLVERAAGDRFKELLAREVAALRVGDPLSVDTDVGPMTAQFQLDTVRGQVDEARRRGARVLAGGTERADLGPLYFAPTVIEDAPSDAAVERQETFGPVVTVRSVGDMHAALDASGAAGHGLTTSIWTRDRNRVRELLPRLECGVVTVNSHLASYGEPQSAWGGCGESGFGRTHGEPGLLETVQTQYVDEGYSDKPDLWWYPSTGALKEIVERTLDLLASPSLAARLRVSLKLLPHLGRLSRHADLWRTMPRFWRYWR